MRLHLVRHGETAYNRDGLGLGRLDIPLTEHGARQAAAIGRRFANEPIARVLSSPLGRAMAVASAIAGERLTIEPHHGLIELDVGETEGLQFAEMRTKYSEFLKEWGGPSPVNVRMPGGESLQDVADRLEPLLADVKTWDVPAAALVAHNFVLKIAICMLLNLELGQFRSLGTDVASVTTLAFERGRIQVVSLNDTCHLRELNLPVHAATVRDQ